MENEKLIQFTRITVWTLIILFFLFSMFGCANMPTSYNDYVRITGGIYKGQFGKLIGDCSWFENYKVRLYDGRKICVRSWNMEKN